MSPTEPQQHLTEIQHYLKEFHDKWAGHLGETGELLANDLRKLVDLILHEYEAIVEETIEKRVASWALANSKEQIPLNKISKEGLAKLLANPEYISNGELWELLKPRFDPPR